MPIQDYVEDADEAIEDLPKDEYKQVQGKYAAILGDMEQLEADAKKVGVPEKGQILGEGYSGYLNAAGLTISNARRRVDDAVINCGRTLSEVNSTLYEISENLDFLREIIREKELKEETSILKGKQEYDMYKEYSEFDI